MLVASERNSPSVASTAAFGVLSFSCGSGTSTHAHSCLIRPRNAKKGASQKLNVPYSDLRREPYSLTLSLLQACAPRYIYYVFMSRLDPVGLCYTATGVDDGALLRTKSFRPCVELGEFPATMLTRAPVSLCRLALRATCGSRTTGSAESPWEGASRPSQTSQASPDTPPVKQVRVVPPFSPPARTHCPSL